MNQAYKLVWDEMRRMLVIVAENSSRRGKKTGKGGGRALVAPVFALTLAAGMLAPMGGAWAAVCQAIPGGGNTPQAMGNDYAQNSSLVCGYNASVGNQSASTPGVGGTAIGANASANHDDFPSPRYNVYGTAVGFNAKADGESAVAIGGSGPQNSGQATFTPTTAYGRGAIAIGAGAVSSARDQIKASVYLGQTIAIGQESLAEGEQSIALGANTKATGGSSIAIGGDDVGGDVDDGAKLKAAHEAVGRLQSALDGKVPVSDIIGRVMDTTSSTKPYWQDTTHSEGNASVAIGPKAHSAGDLSNAFGMGAESIGEASMAMGAGAYSGGNYANAVGAGALTTAGRANAIGFGAQGKVEDGVALGSFSVADRGQETNSGYDVRTNKAYEGAGADGPVWTSTLGAVSVGGKTNDNTWNTRRITNVAAGANDTDVVNVAQLKRTVSTQPIEAKDGVAEYAPEFVDQNGNPLIFDGTNLYVDAGNGVKGDIITGADGVTPLVWDGNQLTYNGAPYSGPNAVQTTPDPNKLVTAGDVKNTINNVYWNAIGDKTEGVTDGYEANIKAGHNVIFQSTDDSIGITQKTNADGSDGTTFDFKGLKVDETSGIGPDGDKTYTTLIGPNKDASGNDITYNIGGWQIQDPNGGDNIVVKGGGVVNFTDGTGTTVSVTNSSGTPTISYSVDKAGDPTTGTTPGQVGGGVGDKYWDSQQTQDAINSAYWNVHGYNAGSPAQPNAAPVKAGDTVKVVANRGLGLTQDDKTLGLTATYAWKDSSGKVWIRSYNEGNSYENIEIGPNVSTTTPTVGVGYSGGKVVAPTDPHDPSDPDYDPNYANRAVTASSVTEAVNNTYWTGKADDGKDIKVNPGDQVTFTGGKTGGASGKQNITVKSSEEGTQGTLEFTLAEDIDLGKDGSLTIGDTTGGTKIEGDEITFNGSGGTINNVASHFTQDVTNAPSNPHGDIDTSAYKQAATYEDVVKSGWNLQANDSAVDYVTQGNTVNFTSGDTNYLTIEPESNGQTSTLKFTVKAGNIVGSGLEAGNDTTIGTGSTGNPVVNVNQGGLKVDNGTVNYGAATYHPDGTVKRDGDGYIVTETGDPNKNYYVTAQTVAKGLEDAAQKYEGDAYALNIAPKDQSGQSVNLAAPGAGGTLPVVGRTYDQADGVYNGTYYSSHNMQVVTARVQGSGGAPPRDILISQMSNNPTFRNRSGQDTVKISGDKGQVQAGNVVMGNQTPPSSSYVGNGGPNPATGNYVTGLDNKQWRNGNYVSGRAATEDQLQQVAESMDLSFSGDRNIWVGRSGNHVSIRLNPNVHVDSVTVNDGVYVVDGPSMTKQGINAAGTTITNVAPGIEETDAVNVGQLRRLEHKVNKMGDRADAGIAGAMAAAAVPQVTVPGANLLGAGAGYFHDQSAVAVGYSAMSDNGRWIMKANASVSTEEAAASAGVGYQW